MAEEQLQSLVRKRGAIKARLTICKRFLNELGASDNLENIPMLSVQQKTELEMRSIRFQELNHDFDTVQDQIDMLVSEEDLEAHSIERETFENVFFQISARITGLLEQKFDHSVVASHTNNVVNTIQVSNAMSVKSSQLNNDIVPNALAQHTSQANSAKSCSSNDSNASEQRENRNLPSLSGSLGHAHFSNVKLPVLQLEKFDGKSEHFTAFYEAFQSLVHNNSKLDNVARFLYLRSCLSQDALRVIKSLEVTSANYQVAWDLLKRRYLNANLMIHNHIKNICEFPKIAKESASSLLQLLDNVQNHVRALIALGEPVQH